MRRLLILLFFTPLFALAQPDVKWRKSIKTGIQTINAASSLSIDKQNNCYITGTTNERDSAKKILVVKVDEAGNELWRRVYQPENKAEVFPVSADCDLNGDLVICATLRNSEANADILTLKFSAEGILLWTAIHGGVTGLFDIPTQITTDRKNNVLVSGHETVSQSNPDLIVLRYSPGGVRTWIRNFSTPFMDVATGVATDDSCNVYVCGTINSSMRSGDILVMKFDSSGYPKWNYTYDGVEHSVDMASGITLDDSGNVFITGMANHSNEKSDIPLLKLNRSGKIQSEYLFAEDISDAMGNELVVSRKSIHLHATFQDYVQSTFDHYVFLTDKQCKMKHKFRPSSPDITYLYGADGPRGSSILLGMSLVRPENTIAPYIELRDSVQKNRMEYRDSVLISLTRMKDFIISGRDIYFLGDDATENAGTISVVKYSLPDEIRKKPTATPFKKTQ